MCKGNNCITPSSLISSFNALLQYIYVRLVSFVALYFSKEIPIEPEEPPT